MFALKISTVRLSGVVLRNTRCGMRNRQFQQIANTFCTASDTEMKPHVPNAPNETHGKLIYEGRYWKSLRRIRRVSLASCCTGLVIVVSTF